MAVIKAIQSFEMPFTHIIKLTLGACSAHYSCTMKPYETDLTSVHDVYFW